MYCPKKHIKKIQKEIIQFFSSNNYIFIVEELYHLKFTTLYITCSQIKACKYFGNLKPNNFSSYYLMVYRLDMKEHRTIGNRDHVETNYSLYELDKNYIKQYTLSSEIIDAMLKNSLLIHDTSGSVVAVSNNPNKLGKLLIDLKYAKTFIS